VDSLLQVNVELKESKDLLQWNYDSLLTRSRINYKILRTNVDTLKRNMKLFKQLENWPIEGIRQSFMDSLLAFGDYFDTHGNGSEQQIRSIFGFSKFERKLEEEKPSVREQNDLLLLLIQARNQEIAGLEAENQTIEKRLVRLKKGIGELELRLPQLEWILKETRRANAIAYLEIDNLAKRYEKVDREKFKKAYYSVFPERRRYDQPFGDGGNGKFHTNRSN